jgi:hypothetical protein
VALEVVYGAFGIADAAIKLTGFEMSRMPAGTLGGWAAPRLTTRAATSCPAHTAFSIIGR